MSAYERQTPETGQLVRMQNKTGIYIGEVTEVHGVRAVVKVLAVLKHPEQGDLHHPYDPDVPMFHERRALSYTEKTTALVRELEPYAGEVPDYRASLLAAADSELERLDRLKRWAERSIEQLEGLRNSY